MIEYAKEDSVFYKMNEAFCKSLENIAIQKNGNLSGFCNSYGYDAHLSFENKKLVHDFIFTKEQTTQNGVYIPKQANEYVGLEYRSKIGNHSANLSYAKSLAKRLFSNKEIRAVVPSPYFLFYYPKIPVEKQAILMKKIVGTGCDSLLLKNGRMMVKMHAPGAQPNVLIDALCLLNSEIEAAFKKGKGN